MSKVDLEHYGRPVPAPRIGRESLGMWLDGAYGWHNTYRVVDAAVKRGFKLSEEDSEILETYRRYEEGADGASMDLLADDATGYLQSLVADDDLMFVWDAGELSLQETTEGQDDV